MVKKYSFLLVLIFALILPIFAEGQQEESGSASVEDWEKYAGLGAYTPENEDIKEVEAKAKEEGHVVIYSLSSRVFEFGRTFYKKYGIRIEASDLPTPNIQEK